VIKYGYPIGRATENIAKGSHVHTHNLHTALEGKLDYTYDRKIDFPEISEKTFMGYKRKDRNAGIRNEVWIIPTVGCINGAAKLIEAEFKNSDIKVLATPHNFGCSQLADDHLTTQKILKSLVNHPNCAAALVLGLGCENNNIDEFKKILGDYDCERVKFLNAQDSEDEVAEGIEIVKNLCDYAHTFKREPVPCSQLTVGLKCGGSDGLSGITANPLVGRFCNYIVQQGASCILTEVPEMFGAEHILMNRCVTEEIFDKAVNMINGFKDYFIGYGQPIYENPSPGNKKGGITTLEDKSLGCIQKGGDAPVVDVLGIGDPVTVSGLNLLYGPGNDMVAVTNLIASGAQLVLFTTGRGTPYGGVVPTIKIGTNSPISNKKDKWIDFDAEKSSDEEFFALINEVIEGKPAKNELYGYTEISIFKNGVTL